MAFWIGGVRLPDAGFRLFVPSSQSSITIRPRAQGEWEVIPAGVFNGAGGPLIPDPLLVDPHQIVEINGADSYLRLTPLPSGQRRSDSAPPTAPGDMQLVIRAYDQNHRLSFQIYPDRLVSPE